MHEIRFNDIHGVERFVDLTQEKFSFAFNADCMDLLCSLPDKSVALACVDPPYGDASSQSVNVERERERERRYNRFGGWFDRYKTVEPIRTAVRPVQASGDGTDSRAGQHSSVINSYPPSNCQNMVNPSNEPEEPGRRSTGKKS